MIRPTETMDELNLKAFKVLCKELGLARALRVFQQMGVGSGNYTEERLELFKTMTNDEFERDSAELSVTQ
jgi:hypothetical protein